jgi:hypothetical protein
MSVGNRDRPILLEISNNLSNEVRQDSQTQKVQTSKKMFANFFFICGQHSLGCFLREDFPDTSDVRHPQSISLAANISSPESCNGGIYTFNC